MATHSTDMPQFCQILRDITRVARVVKRITKSKMAQPEFLGNLSTRLDFAIRRVLSLIGVTQLEIFTLERETEKSKNGSRSRSEFSNCVTSI